MITYKNISFSAKTFYGIEFAPGEIKAVPGYINSPNMIRVSEVTPMVSTDVSEKDTEDTVSVDIPNIVAPVSNRGRKKKSSEPEKGLVAETTENTIMSEEEKSNGNQC